MHEMSVALNIVKISEDKAKAENIEAFSAIDLEIGSLAGIELDALKSVWPAAIKNSALESAEMRIIEIKAQANCRSCNTEFTVDFLYDNCPSCGSFQKHIICGQELRIKALEIPD
ncbi:MAG: hydrogenase maturation nickel metallochaperone HypA [Bacteroidia bacterium]|nr:hydrogenase maturation nickel metallochaperone HypA [Bacteroidia bacterium]MBT8270078.1 hydrogenase maturation nickel metallochaperone HypA [Bacteroidia bacterium]NNF82680.1 hydrogenase maturation nickel metallochaperone HypA [Flavobacteriaceae bacterium]NNK70695.1 hydrogenase maturation nickel metallochaperone HypA [Flavobacteriaceae bacterium]NNL81626.1 hydrogenase maturation nickel metallochaperone HypA [Flavobacteriaceae bacterium]